MSKKNKNETDAIRTQIARSSFLEHSNPLYLTSSFVFEDAEDMRVRQVGIEWCVNQSKELIDFGVPFLHNYSMGKSDNIHAIAKEVF